jgi:proton-dependent oligopeptide transporter, POT family
MSPARGFFGQPAGMSTMFFTEMWERFSYYGMRALLILFLTGAATNGGFGIDDRTAAAIYGLYTAGVYLAALPGGWIADRLIGTQTAALAGGIIIAIGHVLLGISGQAHAIFYFGLVVIVLGTGLLKPNLTAVVAQLYPEGGYRRDVGFTIYYMSVNLGAFIGPLITGWLAQKYGWHVGFLAAAVGMMLGVVYFIRTRARLGDAGRTPAPPPPGTTPLEARRWLTGIGVACALVIALIWTGVIPLSPVALQGASALIIASVVGLYFVYMLFFAGLTPVERRRGVLMLLLFVGAALFWSGFEQAGSSFTLFAERLTERHFGGFEMPSAWFQSFNPIFIVAFAPILSALWIRLGARNLDPSSPAKFMLGLLGMALGFLILAYGTRLAMSGQLVGVGWLTAVYFIHTIGELCLSPIGQSTFTKLAPPRLVAQSLGVWFMTLSLGNLMASRLAGDMDTHHLDVMAGQLMHIFWFGAVSAVVLWLVGTAIRRWIAVSKE